MARGGAPGWAEVVSPAHGERPGSGAGIIETDHAVGFGDPGVAPGVGNQPGWGG